MRSKDGGMYDIYHRKYCEGSAWWAGEGEGVASNVADALSGLGDLERGITRSLHGTAAPAEFYNVMRRMASIAPKLGVSVSRVWRTMFHAPRQHCRTH